MVDGCSGDNCNDKPLSLHHLAMAAAEAQILLTSEEEAGKGMTFQPLNILVNANRSQIDLESVRILFIKANIKAARFSGSSQRSFSSGRNFWRDASASITDWRYYDCYYARWLW